MKALLFGVAVVSMVWSVVGTARGDYIYTTLEVPGASSSQAYGINDAGQIVGAFRTGGPTVQTHGFLFSGGGYNQLDVPGTTSGTLAFGINASGQIVGTYNQGVSGLGSGSAFLLSGGNYTALPTPPFPGVVGITANGINDAGQIVGAYNVLEINRFPPATLFVGGYLLSGGSYTNLTGVFNGSASGINNAGQIVLSNGAQSAVLSGSTLTPISVVGSMATLALGINNLGQVVGRYTDESPAMGPYYSFVYSDGSYTTVSVPGSLATDAMGINDFGQIVGNYFDAAGNDHAFLATPTPEPSTFVLLGIGLLGIMGYAWRKRRALSGASA